jgi:hypothetical protein
LPSVRRESAVMLNFCLVFLRAFGCLGAMLTRNGM